MHLRCMVPRPKPNSPQKDVHPKLVAKCGLACILVGAKKVSLPCRTLLLDAEVGAVDCHQTILADIVDETALKNNLWFGVRRWTMQQGETMTGEDITR
jgi:hypothetical protein